MSQLVEELVRSGQPRNLMSTHILMWESTTIAGILMGILEESGASPLIQRSNGSTALFQAVLQSHLRSFTFRPTMTMSLTAMVSTPVQPWMLVLSLSLSLFARQSWLRLGQL